MQLILNDLEKDTKQEGESCGDCFSPSTNFFCGVCAPGLECRESPDADILPDAPPRCVKISGISILYKYVDVKFNYLQLGEIFEMY